MIILLLIISLIISLGLNVATFVLIKNFLKKISIYEEWILEIKSDIMQTVEDMRVIDNQGVFASRLNDKGIFESDDQVGSIFKELLDLIEKLNQRTQ